jgi:hypothetical protein
MTDTDRFMEKVEQTETCWLWLGARGHAGYGQFWLDGRLVGAHRAAYQLFVGPIPVGLTLDHLCRVRRCVRPDHLEAVTNRENILRGANHVAAQARQTHCLRGHEFAGDNLRVRQGKRYCQACEAQRERRYGKAAIA